MGARVRPHFLQEIPHQILSEHTPREARPGQARDGRRDEVYREGKYKSGRTNPTSLASKTIN